MRDLTGDELALEDDVSRRAALRELGVSDAVVALAMGDFRPPETSFRVNQPWHAFQKGIGVPAGPPLTVLWECGIELTAARPGPSTAEYVRFSLEAPDEYRVLHAEEALLADLFCDLYEDDLPLPSLEALASQLDFMLLPDVLTFYADHPNMTHEVRSDLPHLIAARRP